MARRLAAVVTALVFTAFFTAGIAAADTVYSAPSVAAGAAGNGGGAGSAALVQVQSGTEALSYTGTGLNVMLWLGIGVMILLAGVALLVVGSRRTFVRG